MDTFNLEIKNLSNDNDILNLSHDESIYFEQLTITESIFQHYPVAKMLVPDISGIVTEEHNFKHGIPYTFKLSSMGTFGEVDEKVHNFYCMEAKIEQSDQGGSSMRGDVVLSFMSDFHRQSYPKSRSFDGQLSSFVEDIVGSYDYPVGVTPQHIIVETQNSGIYGQGLVRDEIYLDDLVKVALSRTSKKLSGYVAGWRLDSSYVFADLWDLSNQQPKGTLVLNPTSPLGSTDSSIAATFSDVSSSFSFNRYHVNSVYYNRDNASLKTEESDLSSAIIRTEDAENFPDNTEDHSDYFCYGLAKEENYEDVVGFTKGKMVDSVTSKRLNLLGGANTKYSIGDVVSVEISKGDSDAQELLSEKYSGKHLVVTVTHTFSRRGSSTEYSLVPLGSD